MRNVLGDPLNCDGSSGATVPISRIWSRIRPALNVNYGEFAYLGANASTKTGLWNFESAAGSISSSNRSKRVRGINFNTHPTTR